ncbi:ABC transporter permease subunit [Paenibacillus sp. YPG26]|uniref:ABC transporter permease subunit n=1 Tax=Paenibacillus sp. YPG26 TaxID=2878915 RepID=UPI00203F974E|nr:ABC transporter permease subunit [Paenibacillus sp. YPG26]USB33883.1 ABC transporter permease subunit [Paenibacillus sp. YPG26]
MNPFLYMQMLKIHAKGISSYAFGSAFYILVMFWLYPSIAENTQVMDELLKSVPAGITRAFGLENGMGSLESFLSGEYYGLIFIVILSIFSLMVSTQLMARMVDQGSMAYLLSTPTTRGRVACTQALVLITGLLIIVGATTLAGFAGNLLFIADQEAFHAGNFLRLNLVGFLMFCAVGAVSFLISSASNDERRALSISGVLVIGSFALDLFGKLSEQTEWIRHASIFSLFRPSEIVTGSEGWIASSWILSIIGVGFFALSIWVFRKRDLPL